MVEEKDRKEVKRNCPYCRNEITMKKGLNSDNIKRLFRKPTVEDLIMLFIVFLAIGSFLVYTYEVKAYKAYINDNCPLGQYNQQNTEIYLPGDSLELNETLSKTDSDSTFELNNTNQTNEKG